MKVDNKRWKLVEGTTDIEVSNFGDVRSLSGFNFTPVVQKGYAKVGLIINGEKKQISIHRLVAKAFVSNPYNKPEINHKNGDTLNNCEWNLEWCTPYENQMHRRYVLGKDMVGEKNPMYNKRGEKNPKFKEFLIACDEDGKTVGRFATQTEAATELLHKYSQAHSISKCLSRKYQLNTVGGFYWFYETDYQKMMQADLKPRELLEHPELLTKHYLGQSATKPYCNNKEGSETIESIG